MDVNRYKFMEKLRLLDQLDVVGLNPLIGLNLEQGISCLRSSLCGVAGFGPSQDINDKGWFFCSYHRILDCLKVFQGAEIEVELRGSNLVLTDPDNHNKIELITIPVDKSGFKLHDIGGVQELVDPGLYTFDISRLGKLTTPPVMDQDKMMLLGTHGIVFLDMPIKYAISPREVSLRLMFKEAANSSTWITKNRYYNVLVGEVFIANASHKINQHLIANYTYDPVRDLVTTFEADKFEYGLRATSQFLETKSEIILDPSGVMFYKDGWGNSFTFGLETTASKWAQLKIDGRASKILYESLIQVSASEIEVFKNNDMLYFKKETVTVCVRSL